MNSFQFMGRLTRDPELRYTPNGTPVVEVGVALNRRYTASDGESREEVTFIDVVYWRRAAEIVAEHFRKGKMIAGTGRLKQEEWNDKEGRKRRILKVQGDRFYFCGDSKDSQSRPAQSPVAPEPAPPPAPTAPMPPDDIPF